MIDFNRLARSRSTLIVAAVVMVGVVIALIVAGTAGGGKGTPKGGGTTQTGLPSPTSSSAGIATTSGGPAAPKTGAYLGAWVEPTPFSQPGRVASMLRFESLVGAQMRIVHLYRLWAAPVGTVSDLAFAKRGSYLLISWQTPDLNEIINGSQDQLIAERARQIGALPTKVFLELRWEMDRPNLQSVVHSGATYIAAWKHVRAIFSAQHVNNVGWTWCPTGAGFDNGSATAYYPGDSQVDWICADIYPKTPYVKNSYESFPTLMTAFMAFADQHPTKPVIIGEFGDSPTYGARQAGWITDAESYVIAHPQIKAIAWFNQTHASEPKFHHYALTTGSAAAAAFSKMAKNPYFQPPVP
jgi:hypothetical protein